VSGDAPSVGGHPPLGAMTITTFLEALASKAPVPGGGAASALALGQAAALSAMVVEYSIGKPSLVTFDAELRQARADLTVLRHDAMRLMDEDAAAYAALNAAFALPKEDPVRAARISTGAVHAIQPPSEIVDFAGELLEKIADLVPKTSPPLRSDLGVAGALALAAAEGGAFNVRANLPLLVDERARADHAHGTSLARARDAKAKLDATIEAADAARRR